MAWQGDAPDGRRGLTSNSKVAEMWKDVGRTVTPLYASPSKRVERLETALTDVLREATTAKPFGSHTLPPDLIARLQALQGGRS